MAPKQHSMADVRKAVADLMKSEVSKVEEELRQLRIHELRKADKSGLCPVCKKEDLPGSCTCLKKEEGKYTRTGERSTRETPEAVLPSDAAPKSVTPKKTGSGGLIRSGKLRKDTVPMAAAPTKPGTAAPPKSTVSKPKAPPPPPMTAPKGMGGAPKATGLALGKSEAALRIDQRLAKAGPRLGGKDPASQSMTAHAFSAAPVATGAPPLVTGKLIQSPDAQASRHAQFTDFTPAGAFTAPGKGAVAGEMQAAAKAKETNHLARFKAAGKPAPAGPAGL